MNLGWTQHSIITEFVALTPRSHWSPPTVVISWIVTETVAKISGCETHAVRYLGVNYLPDLAAASLQLFAKRLESRSELTRDELSALVALRGQISKIGAHIDFVRAGEPVDHACLVVDGLVGRFGQNTDGSRQITCFYIPGDMADLPSVVSPKAPWGLSALARTTILRVPHADLRRLAATHPGIAEAFWRDCVADGSIFSEWVVNVGSRDAISRVAHVFCEMAIRSERAGQGNRLAFPLPLTQTDLGDATGLTSVHINRTLRELRLRSAAELHSGKVTIHDWEQLTKIGDFDAGFMLLGGQSPRIAEAA
jgi:CRP-like cAMP-binding protein